MRLFVLQKKLLQFFQTKDYKIQKILEDINFILHLCYWSDILAVMNYRNCYFQGPRSNIVDFVIKFRGEQNAARKPQAAFDPRDVALQLFMRNTEDLFLFCNCTYTPHFQVLCGRRLFLLFHPPFAFPVRLKTFFLLFGSPMATLRLFYFSASGSFNENFLPTL